MATDSSTLAWRIPRTEEPEGLQSMGSQYIYIYSYVYILSPRPLAYVRVCPVTKSCPTLCDQIGCSRPGSSVHGIHHARILGRVAISFSKGSSRPRDQT